jgi:hypothetical protein
MYATHAIHTKHATHDRKRIRRPHGAPPDYITLQPQPVGERYITSEGVSASSAGHSFGRVAVTSPARAIRHADQADSDRDEQDGDEKTPPTQLPTDDLDIETAGASDDETETISMDTGATKDRSNSRPVRIRAKLELATPLSEEAANPEKASDFGITHFNKPTYTTRSVTREHGVFVVRAKLASDINIKVRPSLGPNNQVNIEGDSDSDITSANYPAIVQDLAPFPGKPEAGSPCTHFWARDLTLKHERVHASDDERYGKQGTETAQDQLNGLKAKDTATVDALLDRVPDFVLGNVAANMGQAAEKRAYTRISPDYQARADAIKKKGDSGTYPPSP